VLVLFAVLPYVWRKFQGQATTHNAAQSHKSSDNKSVKPHDWKPGATEGKNGAGKTATGDWQATSGQKAPPS